MVHENTEKEKISLDEVLNKFSIFGKYHLQFIILSIFTFGYNLMLTHNYIFVIEEVKYRCIDEVFGNNTCGVVQGKQCMEWIYENPHSFVAEFQLACQEWKRTIVGTIHIAGYMAGLFIIGPLTDRIGRKNTLIWTGIISSVFGMVKSFSHSYWLYVTLEFLYSCLGDNYSPLFLLGVEIVSAKKRIIFSFICTAGTAIGGIFVPLIAWNVPYWRDFLRAISIPGLLFCAFFFLIDESPKWLLSKGKKDDTIAILNKMARMNKIQIDKDALDNLFVEEEENTEFVDVLKKTFRSRTLLKRFIVCTVWWTSSTFVYHGLLINTVSLQGEKYLNYGLAQLVNLSGNFILMYILHNCKRKVPLVCTFFIAALLCFVQPFLPTGLSWLSVAMYIISSLMSSMFFDITTIYTSELFPTYTRSFTHSICSAIGKIGGLTAPLTPLLLEYWSGFPTLLFGGASLAAGLVTFLVPDIGTDALPDNVLEAENIGMKKRVMTGMDNLAMT